MPEYWTKVDTNSDLNSWDFPISWVPDAVIIYLGDNDMNRLKKTTQEEFQIGYLNLMQNIYDSYKKFAPQIPKIISLCGSPEKLCQWMENSMKNFK